MDKRKRIIVEGKEKKSLSKLIERRRKERRLTVVKLREGEGKEIEGNGREERS